MRKIRSASKIGAALIFIAVIAVIYISIAPRPYPVGTSITVKKGLSLSETASLLKGAGLIKSKIMFRAYVGLVGSASGVQAGNYYFEQPESALKIAYRVAKAIQGVEKVKITVPEGLASSDIATLIKKKLPNFDDATFRKLAKPLEGYLFPDTYFFDQFTKPEDVIALMRANFDDQTDHISPSRSIKDKTFEEILIMASLVEEEAKNTEERRIIAGILWKRLKTGMPLQVDAPFFYILGKTSAELTQSDLAMDSKYNTYANKGLPPTPIDNPSLDAIKASADPLETEYWFFLAGSDGKIHFSTTHDEHVANKFKYLN